jgi:hypothetical protein
VILPELAAGARLTEIELFPMMKVPSLAVSRSSLAAPVIEWSGEFEATTNGY